MAGCFFTTPVNSEPQAQLETVAPGPYFRGGDIALTAYKSDDPDGDELTVDWSAYTCSADRTVCDAPAFARLTRVRPEDTFSFAVPTRRATTTVDEPVVIVSVAATVRDEHGASHEDRLFVDISNRAPEVDLQVQGARVANTSNSYPTGSWVRIVAQNQDLDEDAVTYSWAYQAPIGSIPGDVAWTMLAQDSYQLQPDIEGLWSVEVTATDELGAATVVSVPIDMQPDALPCVGSTDPWAVPGGRYIVDRAGLPRRFAVLSVSDDLDAYPPRTDEAFFQSARFHWSVATPYTGGAWTSMVNHGEADYLLVPSAYAPGDRVSLRVEIDDRKGRDVVCAADAATCSLSGDTCLQRVTWEVEIR